MGEAGRHLRDGDICKHCYKYGGATVDKGADWDSGDEANIIPLSSLYKMGPSFICHFEVRTVIQYLYVGGFAHYKRFLLVKLTIPAELIYPLQDMVHELFQGTGWENPPCQLWKSVCVYY